MTTELLSLQNVQPKAGTPGVAQDAPPPSGGGGGSPPPGSALVSFLPFLILIPFFFLMFRRQKNEQAARSKLKKGDKVVSSSGLIGELVELDERIAKVKIAPGTTVQMLPSSISPFGATAETAAKKDEKKDEAKDTKDVKAAADKK